LSRVKNHWGIPRTALQLLSKKYKIDKIVIGSHLHLSREEFEIFEAQLLGNPSNPPGKYAPTFPGFESKYSDFPPRKAMESLILSLLDSTQEKPSIEFIWVHHHDAHTGAALTLFEDSEFLVFSFDGHGDGVSSQVTKVKNVDGKNEAIHLSRTSRRHSLGSLYSACTEIYNFKPNNHEGKITGLSAFGGHSSAVAYLEKQIRVRNGLHSLQIYPGTFFKLVNKLLKSIGFDKSLPHTHLEILRKASNLTREYGDLAFATQRVLEEKICEIVHFYVEKYKLNKVALTGGIFANVVFNARIAKIDGVTSVRIFPNMGDGGLCVGGVWWHLFETGKLANDAFPDSLFLGPEIESLDQLSLTSIVKDPQLTVTQMTNSRLVKHVCELLSSGKVVGIHKGRMEFGPRALCNRSILIDPRSRDINKSVNFRLRRTEFMPFAPVVAADAFSCYFETPQQDLFPFYWMTMICDVRSEYRHLLSAVTHIDGTARPQIVSEVDDPLIYSILKEFEKETGVACLVNTSFNLHEEPINFQINDSIMALKRGACDALIVPGQVITLTAAEQPKSR
jgi:carbamoyltransferase